MQLAIAEDGTFSQLQRFAEDGSLIYYTTYAVAVARSTRANHLNVGGSLGLNLDGQNMIGYVWDGGHSRVTHQERLNLSRSCQFVRDNKTSHLSKAKKSSSTRQVLSRIKPLVISIRREMPRIGTDKLFFY